MSHTRTVYLVRHAPAGSRGPAFPDDRKRPLTEDGAARFRQAVRGLAAIGVEVDIVLTSPLVRAHQTAEILVAGLPPRPRLDGLAALAPRGRAPAVLQALASHRRPTRVALVGHEPGIGDLAAALLGMRHPVPFKKGAVCAIELPHPPVAGAGTLLWYLPPRVLRRLGG